MPSNDLLGASERKSRNRKRLAGYAFGGIITLAAYEGYVRDFKDLFDDDDGPTGGAVITGIQHFGKEVAGALANPYVSTGVGLLVLTLAYVFLSPRKQHQQAL